MTTDIIRGESSDEAITVGCTSDLVLISIS